MQFFIMDRVDIVNAIQRRRGLLWLAQLLLERGELFKSGRVTAADLLILDEDGFGRLLVALGQVCSGNEFIGVGSPDVLGIHAAYHLALLDHGVVLLLFGRLCHLFQRLTSLVEVGSLCPIFLVYPLQVLFVELLR